MLRQRDLLISSLILGLPFLLARFPWYAFLPVVGITSDTTGYVEAAYAMLNGEWPLFDFRNPGYPLLLLLPLALGKGLWGVVLMHSLLALGAAVFLVYELRYLLGKKVVFAALAMSLFLISRQQLIHETSVLSDAPFSAALMALTAMLLKGIRQRTAGNALLLATLYTFTLMLRPAAIAFLPVLLIWGFWQWRKGYPGPHLLGGAALVLVLILSLSAYNYRLSGRFGMAGTPAVNRFGATLTYAQAHPDYPDALNEGLREYQESLAPERLVRLEHAVDPRVVMAIYTEEYEKMWPLIQRTLESKKPDGECPTPRLSCVFPELARVARDAMLEHPGLFLRYWGMSFTLSAIRSRCNWSPDFPDAMKARYLALSDTDLRWMLDPAPGHNRFLLDRLAIDLHQVPEHSFSTPRFIRAWYTFQGWLDALLFFNHGLVWTLLTLLAGLYGLFLIVFRGNRDAILSLMVALSLSWFIYLAMVTMVVYPLERLTYPVEWLRYLAVTSIALWLIRENLNQSAVKTSVLHKNHGARTEEHGEGFSASD
ncbi:MAG TPA: hypothetical protein P5550_01180 [Bacteroidales bacterium]|nr:hypothetical protein [Bacteroidales bacterium]